MRAIDTNVIVRFLTNDDEKQSQAARTVLNGGNIFVSLTVCLETAWVLRRAYGFQAEQVASGLTDIASVQGLQIEDPLALATAIEWMLAGMDFADALHLANAEGCTAFVSFDRKLAKTAKGRSPIPVETP